MLNLLETDNVNLKSKEAEGIPAFCCYYYYYSLTHHLVETWLESGSGGGGGGARSFLFSKSQVVY